MNNQNVQSNLYRTGYVAIAGRPNVGKSTLMNTLLGQKLAIVSPRPQTTRHRVLGILQGESYQIIFLDTPGLMEPTYLLQEAMTRIARQSLAEADIILMMTEATGVHPLDEKVVAALKSRDVPRIMLINKVDLISKEQILPLIDHFSQYHLFRDIIPISALHKDGLNIVLDRVLESLPYGEPFYPPDMISDEPERFFVAEIVREQIFLQYGEEIPYATAVTVEEFKERPGKKDYIKTTIIVERESQKGIIIGKGGKKLGKVGRLSRESIEQLTGRPVYLDLQVRVRKKWRKDPKQLKRLGF
jgi:GTP-binding protein Era